MKKFLSCLSALLSLTISVAGARADPLPEPVSVRLSSGVSILPFSSLAMPLLFDVGSSIRGGGGGVAASDNIAWTGTNSFIDGNFSIIGSADPTKIAKFEVDGFTTATTRTFTLPNASTTIAGTNVNQTFSGTNTHSGAVVVNSGQVLSLGTSSNSSLLYSTANTPDTVRVVLPATSNSLDITDTGDISSDMNNCGAGTAAATNPQVCVHSGATDTTNYSSLSVGGVTGKMVKTLTEGVATDIAKVTIAAEEGTGGMLLVSVYATDGATPQVRYLRIHFAATNDGGVTTCTLTTPEEIDHTPTGTLTAAVTCVDGTAAALLQIDATSSLTQTTLESRSQITLSGSGQIQPQ